MIISFDNYAKIRYEVIMQIKQNASIHDFFKRCQLNLLNEHKNDFLGLPISKKTELKIQRKMKNAGFQEFYGPKDTWPSLYISTTDFLKSPYHSNIKLDQINDDNFTYSKEQIIADELFNIDSIQLDEKRELNDWMKLRAIDQSYDSIILWRNDEVWMLDAPSEANTIDPCAKRATGDVLTYGLGIGYFIYMAMLNSNVKSITVIENSQDVIQMFENYLLPQFPKLPLTIIHGDAFDYHNKEYLANFDYVFIDIYQSNRDGLLMIEKLLEQYNPPIDKIDFWIEDSCLEILPTLIFDYFYQLNYHKSNNQDNRSYKSLRKKIANYFHNLDVIIDDAEQIKYYMYDKQTLRAILATKKVD